MNRIFDKLWIVTVNWNRPVLTEQCLHSIIQNDFPSSNIILVDNGSTDSSLAHIKNNFPSIKIIASRQNLGFARGFNLGINLAIESGAEYIFILNNDTEIPRGMFKALYSGSKSLNADISAPAIYYADQPDKLWSTGGNFCCLYAAPINAHNRNKPLPGTPVRREFLSGCALLVRRYVFDAIGVFDEEFFLYYEDLDFIKRAHDAGFTRWLIPQAHLNHRVSASSQGEASPAVYYWMSRSSWLYFKKHAHIWQWIFIIPWRLGHAFKTLLNFIINNRTQNIIPYLTGFLMIKNEQFHRHLPNDGEKPDIRKY